MNDKEIFEYEERQVKRMLQQRKFKFDEQEVDKLTNDVINLIKRVIRHHANDKDILISTRGISREDIKAVLRSRYISYMVTNILRYNSPNKKLSIAKQVYRLEVEGQEVYFNDVTNVLTIGNLSVDMNEQEMATNYNWVLLALISLYPGIDKTEAENMVASALVSNKLSSLNKSRFIDNVLIEMDNIIYPAVINSLKAGELPKPGEIIGPFKTWNTKTDSRVRRTHQDLQSEKINVNDDFNVGGSRAKFPRQKSLPPKEKINCRCWLEFSK